MGQDGKTIGIIGSRFQVHHLGLTGELKEINWKLRTKYSNNLGTFGRPFEVKKEDFYCFHHFI
jgi:hypothetical protein